MVQQDKDDKDLKHTTTQDNEGMLSLGDFSSAGLKLRIRDMLPPHTKAFSIVMDGAAKRFEG